MQEKSDYIISHFDFCESHQLVLFHPHNPLIAVITDSCGRSCVPSNRPPRLRRAEQYSVTNHVLTSHSTPSTFSFFLQSSKHYCLSASPSCTVRLAHTSHSAIDSNVIGNPAIQCNMSCSAKRSQRSTKRVMYLNENDAGKCAVAVVPPYDTTFFILYPYAKYLARDESRMCRHVALPPRRHVQTEL